MICLFLFRQDVGGYEVPAGTMITAMQIESSKNASIFPLPSEFRPERFLVEPTTRRASTLPTPPATACPHAADAAASSASAAWPHPRPDPWAHLPFGFGPRMCQGARLAEMEMELLLLKLLPAYRWTSVDADAVQPSFAMFIKPDRPLQLQWQKLR